MAIKVCSSGSTRDMRKNLGNKSAGRAFSLCTRKSKMRRAAISKPRLALVSCIMSDEEPVAMRSVLRRARRARDSDMDEESDGLPHDLSLVDLSIAANSEQHGSVTPTPRATKFANIDMAASPLSPHTGNSWSTSSSLGPKLTYQLAENRSEKSDGGATPTSGVTSSGSGAPSTGGSVPMKAPVAQEPLVEIRPRRRAKPTRPEARRTVGSSHWSAFDGLPPAETYDPSWGGNQFRVEGGQLRDRSDGNKPRKPLLPGKFKPMTNDETSDEEGNGDECSRLKALRRAAGAAVERRRNVVLSDRPPSEALERLEKLMRERFKAEAVMRRGLEMRARVYIERNTKILVVVNAEDLWRGARLVFRRSLTDRTKLAPDRFLEWVAQLRELVCHLDKGDDAA